MFKGPLNTPKPAIFSLPSPLEGGGGSVGEGYLLQTVEMGMLVCVGVVGDGWLAICKVLGILLGKMFICVCGIFEYVM